MLINNAPEVDYTPITSVGIELCEAAAPWLTTALAWYLDAIGAMLSPIHDLVVDEGFDGDPGYVPGYGQIFDPDTCPTARLPYLGQFVGVTVPAGLSDAGARALIRAENGQHRGSPDSIIATAKRFLTGTQSVILLERQGPNGPDPDWFQLIVRPEELSSGSTWAGGTYPWSSTTATWTGSDNGLALWDAVSAIKPGGVLWELITTDGHTWSSATLTWSAETVTWAQSDINPV